MIMTPGNNAATMTNSFTAVYKKIGDWYVARVEELPGANTHGRTLDEARAVTKATKGIAGRKAN